MLSANGVTQLMMMKGMSFPGSETLKFVQITTTKEKIAHFPYNIEQKNVTPVYKTLKVES
jgi:adenylosuccinate synthase